MKDFIKPIGFIGFIGESDQAPWSISDLFANGESGLLLSYQPGHLYADVTNTTPATIGGGIASFDDLSGNSVTGPQPVSTARPIMGRVPRTGRRNLFTNTTALAGAVVGVVGSGGSLPTGWGVPAALGLTVEVVAVNVDPVIGGVRIRVYGEATDDGVFRLQVTSIVGMVQGQQYRGSIHAVKRAGDACRVANVNLYTEIFDIPLDTDAQLSESRIVLNSATSPSASGYRIEIRKVGISSGESYDFTVDVGGSQFEVGSETTPYQRVTTDYDVTEAGIPSVYYTRYDSADDVLPKDVTLPAITDGTVILIGKDGIWIDEGYSFAGGNWSFGPTTYPNGPDGIIGVVGDMLDLVVLDRPLTPQESQKVIQVGVRRGSAGLITVGDELVPNPGGPFTTIDGWITFGGASLDVVSGALEVTRSGGTSGAQVAISGLAGATCLVESIYSGGTSPSGGAVRDTSTNINAHTAPGALSSIYTFNTTFLRLTILGATEGSTNLWWSVSVRRLIMPGETP